MPPVPDVMLTSCGKIMGHVSEGNSEDIREAVEAVCRAVLRYITDWL